MSGGRKQFAVYRLKKGLWENEALRYRSWNYLQKFHIQVQSDRYEQVCVSRFSWDLDASDLRRQLENGLPASLSGEKLEVSDVLAVTKEGITTAYYVNPEKLIVLAGFLKILSPDFIRQYPDRIINIHPSLLPSFKGAHAVEDAVAYGVKVYGITIHWVNADLDGGQIIAQRAFPYEGSDPAEVHRLGQPIEHELYVETIKKLIQK